MLNQGLQSRRSGIKGPPVWARGPPRSRAPFTFVKEINLPLLSAGRGQSGRKRDACCRPGGGGGNLSSEAGCGLGEDKLPPPLPPGKDNSEDPHTHNPVPTTPADPFGPRSGPLPSSSNQPNPKETQKAESPGHRGRTPRVHSGPDHPSLGNKSKLQKMSLCCEENVTHFIEREGNGHFFLESSVLLYRSC